MKNEYSIALKRPFVEERTAGEIDHQTLWGSKLPKVEALPSGPKVISYSTISSVVMNADSNNNPNEMKEEEVRFHYISFKRASDLFICVGPSETVCHVARATASIQYTCGKFAENLVIFFNSKEFDSTKATHTPIQMINLRLHRHRESIRTRLKKIVLLPGMHQ